jgi:5-methylcytosine-specific restriction enzyme A
VANRKPSQDYRRRSRKSDRLPDVFPGSGPLLRLTPAGGDPSNREKAGQGDQPSDQQTFFLVQVSPETVQREKDKARALRKTRWWQRQMDRGICYYCRNPLTRDQVTLDHIVPLIRGGQSNRSNVVPACKSCNSRKKYLLPMEWEDFLRGIKSQDVEEKSPADPLDAHEVSGNE